MESLENLLRNVPRMEGQCEPVIVEYLNGVSRGSLVDDERGNIAF